MAQSNDPALSNGVLIAAAKILLECAGHEDFAIAEIMLRNILNNRATAAETTRLTRIGNQS